MQDDSRGDDQKTTYLTAELERAALLKFIGERRSYPRLNEPAPGDALLKQIYTASLRVPDHQRLKPWRFLSISGDARIDLGALFAKSVLSTEPEVNEERLDKAKSKALRAPLIIVGIVKHHEHPKVPAIEESISAGAVFQNMGLAFYAHDFGSVWRTGAFANCPTVNEGLGLGKGEEIIGYLYVGTPPSRDKSIPELDADDYFKSWSA